MDDKELLEAYGWVIVCESPYEIEHTYSSSEVKGTYAVEIIIQFLRLDYISNNLN